MRRLVVVSNRIADRTTSAQAGGLAVALSDSLKQNGGLWLGWDGEIDDDGAACPAKLESAGKVSYATISLSRRDYDEYYIGYANRVIWPAFHYRLDLAQFEADFLAGCRRVNARFAEALVPLLEPDDLVWIHDYHLMPLAAELRARKVGQRLGFFLHIPFPSKEILVAVPQHQWPIRSLFSFDLLGFQTRRDVSNFLRYVVEEAGGRAEPGGRVTAFGRTVAVAAFPIGIDVDAVRRMARSAHSEAQIKRLRQRILDRRHIIGVDRLDYTKGLARRLQAYEKLLRDFPDTRRTVTFTQIAPMSREDVEAYADIRNELLSLAGEINGEFGEFDWTPLRCIIRQTARRTLMALFRGSQVGLVTPLRDGMNLVAKEFIAAQDEADPGVLVLSRFAGAAEELSEAVIINPYDVDEMVQAMQTALDMPLDRRVERHRALLGHLREYDVFKWRDRFLAALEQVPGEPAR